MRSCTHCSAEEVVTMSQENTIQAMALLIPILSVTVSFGALIVFIVVWYRRRIHEVDCRHKERMAAIEKARSDLARCRPRHHVWRARLAAGSDRGSRLDPGRRRRGLSHLLFRRSTHGIGPETGRARGRRRSDTLTSRGARTSESDETGNATPW